jgi:leucyl-tRNA synthetase
MCNSQFLNGLLSSDAINVITEWLETSEKGRLSIQYKLRDWVFSRQRYWGEPFPIVWISVEDYEQKHDVLAEIIREYMPDTLVYKMIDGKEYVAMPIVPQFLPLELPVVEDYKPAGDGRSALGRAVEWVHVWYNMETGETVTVAAEGFPDGNGWVRGARETDTMPNWAGSSWYFLRYVDPQNDDVFASEQALQYWMNVDWYNGGMEHTVLHLLYSRFWHQFLYDIGYVNTKEPYAKRTSHGMILGSDGEKMSKSRGNVINPDDIIAQYGADVLRTYLMFMGPFNQAISWDTNGLLGVRRFLERVWIFRERISSDDSYDDSNEVKRAVYKAVIKVGKDIDSLGFNTAVSQLMEVSHIIHKQERITKGLFSLYIKILAPFAPHMAEELWYQIGNTFSVHKSEWPILTSEQEALLVDDTCVLAVQVNGKVRGQIHIMIDESDESIQQKALAVDNVRKCIADKPIKKIIIVPKKIVSIVI